MKILFFEIRTVTNFLKINKEIKKPILQLNAGIVSLAPLPASDQGFQQHGVPEVVLCLWTALITAGLLDV